MVAFLYTKDYYFRGFKMAIFDWNLLNSIRFCHLTVAQIGKIVSPKISGKKYCSNRKLQKVRPLFGAKVSRAERKRELPEVCGKCRCLSLSKVANRRLLWQKQGHNLVRQFEGLVTGSSQYPDGESMWPHSSRQPALRAKSGSKVT